MKTEFLCEDKKLYCHSCKEQVEAKKKMELYSAPPILIINLDRFKSKKGSALKDKIEDKVLFPVEELDLSDIIISNKDTNGNKYSMNYTLFQIIILIMTDWNTIQHTERTLRIILGIFIRIKISTKYLKAIWLSL